ncbi:MAG TPA: pyridoxamine 5'-phosphate oxidase family protein [Streptosporangiaceae bacterium]|nr:pyridoxamine 5'-phosphate oxidase family protein [Streptosporangiaceae bacterium]
MQDGLADICDRTPNLLASGSDATQFARRRIQAGMSVEQAAVAAGMAAEYIRYVETSPAPNVSQATLMRLAAALGSSLDELAGTGPIQRPDHEPDAQPLLIEMTPTECWDHLLAGRLGRVVFDEPGRGPVAIPAEYSMDGNDVIIRTVANNSVALHAQHGRVSFDVDHFDDGLAGGWSVLLTGTATPITGQAELDRTTSHRLQLSVLARDPSAARRGSPGLAFTTPGCSLPRRGLRAADQGRVP